MFRRTLEQRRPCFDKQIVGAGLPIPAAIGKGVQDFPKPDGSYRVESSVRTVEALLECILIWIS